MSEEYIFQPKLRVQLLDEEGRVQSDRLVNQKTEFSIGPKQTHKGSMRFEVTFKDQQDIDEFFKYATTYLKDTLPQRELQSKGRPSGTTTTELQSPREDILNSVEQMVSEGNNQKDIISYLRTLGFAFILTEDFLRYFPEFSFESRDTGQPNHNGQYPDSLVWMARRIKKAKDPKSDKWDCMILFGFSLDKKPGKKIKIIPYLYKDRKDPLRVTVENGNKNAFKIAKELTKFPAYMQEEERLKFNSEIRLLGDNPERQPSKFFIRWAPDVILSQDAKRKLSHLELQFKNHTTES